MPGTRCKVAVCRNSLQKTRKMNKNIIYHTFPKNAAIRSQWIQKCKRNGKWNPDTSCVCSEHFTNDDYQRDLMSELLNIPRRRKLKPEAVPSQKLKKIEVKNKGSMTTKYCLVEKCYNDSKSKGSKKIFIRVPQNGSDRKRWFKSIFGHEDYSSTVNLFVCEDHFNLREDAENFEEFRLVGTRLRLKTGVFPHLHIRETIKEELPLQIPSSSKKRKKDNLQSRPSEPATQNATQGNSDHSDQLYIKKEPLEADPSDYRLYQQLRDSIKTELDNSETVPNNGDPEKHIHSISTDKEHFVNVKKEYSDSCENEISVNHETEQIPMFESVFVKEELFEEELPL